MKTDGPSKDSIRGKEIEKQACSGSVCGMTGEHARSSNRILPMRNSNVEQNIITEIRGQVGEDLFTHL